MFCNETGKEDSYYIFKFADAIDKWIEELNLPKLGKFNITKPDANKITAQTSNKNNPVELNKNELLEILSKRI